MPLTPVVLLIEEASELGEVIRAVMTDEGYEVLHVRDTFAAAAALDAKEVDLVVADLPARDAEGRDPLEEIHAEHPGLPLIVIGDPAPGEVPFFGPWRKEGRRTRLRRPFRLADLLGAARELVVAARVTG